MPVVVVANPKGGVGKSTLATNIAGYFASRGRQVMLGDADRQQSSHLWLGLRPAGARRITGWDVGGGDHVGRPPKGTTHVVLDTPAGMHGKLARDAIRIADKVVIPLQASVFDIFATRAFLDELKDIRASHGQVGLVGMRVDERTIAADKLHEFVDSLGLPVLGYLRQTQNYVHLAARGLSLFDLSASRVERDLEQWAGLCRWLDS